MTVPHVTPSTEPSTAQELRRTHKVTPQHSTWGTHIAISIASWALRFVPLNDAPTRREYALAFVTDVGEREIHGLAFHRVGSAANRIDETAHGCTGVSRVKLAPNYYTRMQATRTTVCHGFRDAEHGGHVDDSIGTETYKTHGIQQQLVFCNGSTVVSSPQASAADTRTRAHTATHPSFPRHPLAGGSGTCERSCAGTRHGVQTYLPHVVYHFTKLLKTDTTLLLHQLKTLWRPCGQLSMPPCVARKQCGCRTCRILTLSNTGLKFDGSDAYSRPLISHVATSCAFST